MVKILIADDHELIRTGIKQILRDGFPAAEIGEAFDTTSLIEIATTANWDVIISDISMPGGGGLEALKQILLFKPDQRILIVTTHPQEQYAIRVIRAGAFGFLAKDNAHEQLIPAITVILAGEQYIPQWISDKLLNIE
jgi:two-component system, NarL family, invasion response regulator UvrY